jgi:hypothetical protein
MKTRHYNQQLRIALLGITLAICGCGNHCNNASTGQSLHLIIRTTVSGVDLVHDSIYHPVASRSVLFTDFRYYVSHIVAIRDDGTAHQTVCGVLLVDPRQQDYNLGSLPPGSYQALRFVVGLDSATNHADPTVFESGHPLAMQTPSMHWDWNSGYLFMKLEGRVDTTGTGLPGTEFFYHIGMDAMKRSIDIPVRFTIGKKSTTAVRLKFDLAVLLAGVDMRSEILTHSFDNQILATRIADRWQAAFSPDQ